MVVRVRREGDNAERDFNQDTINSGDIVSWVNVGENYVGYARFQDSTTANVSLTSSFTLEATNNWSIKFGYIGGSTPAGLFGSSGNGNTGFWFGTLSTVGITDDSGFFSALSFGGGLALKIGHHQEVEFFNTPAEGVRVKIDGVTMSGLPKIYGDITIDRVGLSRGRDGERVIENVRIDLNGDGTLDYSYAGDGNQASNWTDGVGSNNGTPTAQVLTYNNEYTSGYVETWYDQSGNDNDAVQLTASNQPKIVDSGSLLNELLFEGSQFFDSIPLSSSAQPNSIFTVSNTNVASQTLGIYGTSASQAGYYRSSNRHAIFSTGTASATLEGSAYVTDRDYLRFDLFNGANSVVGVDGATTSGTTGDSVLDRLDIGDSSLSGVNPLNGGIKELILYLSDQSANRAAIEANINNQYDIY